jgi:hypothetical protein
LLARQVCLTEARCDSMRPVAMNAAARFIKTIQLTEQPVRIDIDPGNTLLKEAKVG